MIPKVLTTQMDIPLWLLFALISPFFWGIVHVLDSYCIDEVFDQPLLASVASGFTMLTALPFLTCRFFLVPWQPIPVEVWGVCLLLGLLFMGSQVLYFHSLAQSESGIVAAYWNLTPVLVLLGGYFLLGEILTPTHYTGAIVLILAASLFCLLDGAGGGRFRTFLMMACGCVLQAGYFLIQKWVFKHCPAYQTFVLSTAGMTLFALSPLSQKRYRRAWVENWPKIRPAVPFLLAIELSNLAAVGLSQFAVSLGPTSLVAAVEACMPAYTFGISICLWAIFRKYGEEEARHRLGSKLVLVGVMAFGVWLVS